MLKEIHEAATVIENTTRGRLIPASGRVKLGGLETSLPELLDTKRIVITACGTANYAGQIGRYLIEEYAGVPVEVEVASEYRYKRNIITEQTALLAVTQSGETADTLACVRKAAEAGLLTLGVVNVIGSTIARETKAGVYNHAGPEIAVASTKAFVSQVTVFALLAILLGREKGSLSLEEGQKLVESLQALPKTIRHSITSIEQQVQSVAARYAQFDNAMFIGRHLHAPLAEEGALKLKEVSYIHAEAYPGGELKHGSIALLDEQFPVIALAPVDDVYEKMRSNIEEAMARSAPVLVITTDDNVDAEQYATDVIRVPKVHPALQPIITGVALQFLAYYVGTKRGINVDRPRNLAKSVTVE